MTFNISQVRVCKDGIMVNGVNLVVKSWARDSDEIGSILSDGTTAFVPMEKLVSTKDTMQCRELLGLESSVDLVVICTTIVKIAHFCVNSNVTSWIASDMQCSSVVISIYGELTPELKSIGVGTIFAILNPDMKSDMMHGDLKSISVRDPDKILIIGELDGLQLCKGITSRNIGCRNMVYIHNQGEYCKYHAKTIKKRAAQKKRVSGKNANNEDKPTVENEKSEAQCKGLPIGIRDSVFTFSSSSKAPINVLSSLVGLRGLLKKVMENRNVNGLFPKVKASKSGSDVTEVTSSSNTKCKEFEYLTSMVGEVAFEGQMEYKKVLGSLRMITKRINFVDKEIVIRCGILKICDRLLDHPVEDVAIESLKLRRALKKFIGKHEEGANA